jgi:hypothetical protein
MLGEGENRSEFVKKDAGCEVGTTALRFKEHEDSREKSLSPLQRFGDLKAQLDEP